MTDLPRPADTSETQMRAWLAVAKRGDDLLPGEWEIVRDDIGALLADLDATRRALDRAEATTQRLRTILAPLLDSPYADDKEGCLFCPSPLSWIDYDAGSFEGHRPDCPVRERDVLLGLVDAAGAGPGRAG